MKDMGQAEPRIKLLTTARDFDAIRNYPGFLEEIRRKMKDGGLSLSQALDARYPGRYDGTAAREIGAKKAGLQQATLNFEDVSATRPCVILFPAHLPHPASHLVPASR